MAGLMPASQAAPVPDNSAARAGTAKTITAERIARLLAALPGGTSSRSYQRILAALKGTTAPVAGLGARATNGTGGLAGLVHAAGGQLSGVCVTATGSAGSAMTRVRPTGRYLLAGLRPGHYQLQVGRCPVGTGAFPAPAAEVSGVFWPGQPGSVTVRPGQLRTLSPATWWEVNSNSLARTQAAGSSSASDGSISGKVTGHGKPLRNICAVAISLRRDRESTVVTAKDGSYHIRHLRPGKYVLLFLTGPPHCPSTNNWLPQTYHGASSPGKKSKVKVITVRARMQTSGIDAKLKLGAEITGTVRAASGHAVSGACVAVISGPGFGRDGSTVYSNATGHFVLHAVAPGKYRILFGYCGHGNYAFQWWPDATSERHAKVIKVTGTKTIKNIDATLVPAATISGTVRAVSASGKPLGGVCVDAVGSDGLFYAEYGATSKTGSYRLAGLAAGTYRVEFDPTCTPSGNSRYRYTQRAVTLTVGQAVTGFDVYLQLGGVISGLVTDADGHPVSGACVQIQDDNNGTSAFTNAKGQYDIFGVTKGSYLVEFSGGCGNKESLAPQYYPNQAYSQDATLVKFTPGTPISGLDATMQPGGTIAGTVTDTAGHPITSKCTAVAQSTTEDVEEYPGAGRARITGGQFRILNLAPGPYDIAFSCRHYGTQVLNSRPSVAGGTSVAVLAGRVTRAGARLSPAATITGTVTDAAGRPARGVCVQALSSAGLASGPGGGTTTGKNGTYRLRGLLAGSYLIQFGDCGGPSTAQQWYRDKLTPAKATRIVLRAGQTRTGIRARLVPAGSITGLTTGPSNRPASYECVLAEDPAEDSFAFGQAAQSGHYLLQGLSAGRYSVYVEACGASNNMTLNRAGVVTVMAGRQTAGADLMLRRPGSVAGRVLGGAAGTSPERQVCVLVVAVNPKGSMAIGYTDHDGQYRIGGLAPGKYRAYLADPSCNTFEDNSDPFAPQWYHDQASSATARTFRVSAGRTRAGIDGTLQPFGGLTGSVDTGVKPVGGECVTAFPFRTGTDPFLGTPPQPELTISDRGGNYALPDLMPGRYKIEFSTGCGAKGFVTQWWHNSASAGSASLIRVKFATITDINATLTH